MPGWTVETLHEHWTAIRAADAELRAADQRAVDVALAAAKEAVAVAELNAEKWRDNANEWRGAMSDRERNFMRRDEFRAFVFSLIGAAVAIGAALGLTR